MILTSNQGRPAHWLVLLVLLLVYAAIFAAWYPPFAGIDDENGFINQAIVWSRGAFSSEAAGLAPDLIGYAAIRGRHVAVRNPGRSLLALPFLLLGGDRALFASGLMIHLGMTIIGAALLARLGRSPLWAVLLLSHPTLAIYSRTIMGDEAAGAGLLLAALAAMSPRHPGVKAGLAVVLAALMRYQAGLALPIVAAWFALPGALGGPSRPREALACLIGGGLAGGLIVTYNVLLYGNPVRSGPNSHGPFEFQYLAVQVTYYAGALMVLWPGMLLAPLLDRSPLRWLTRGLIVVFLGPLCAYYFHDSTPNWAETVIIGQRLLQVALPVWIIAYATVLDDWLAAPIRRRLGPWSWNGLTAIVCLGLLAANARIFARHQDHLQTLRDAREAVAEAIPKGSVVVTDPTLPKLFAVGQGWSSVYEWIIPEMHGRFEDPSPRLERLGDQRWYLAFVSKTPGVPMSPRLNDLVRRHRLKEQTSCAPRLRIFASPAAVSASDPGNDR